jgi:hypothetical protein
MKRTLVLIGSLAVVLCYAAGAIAYESSPIGWASYNTIANPDPCHTPNLNGITASTVGIKNGDGCNPDSSTYVYIFDNTFNTGDDCIAIKSGRDLEGYTIGMPASNI